MIARIQPEKAAGGEVTLPASKSLSHRAILAASLANGVSVLHHSGTNKDILATRKAMEHFGVRFEEVGNDLYVYDEVYINHITDDKFAELEKVQKIKRLAESLDKAICADSAKIIWYLTMLNTGKPLELMPPKRDSA